jgi:L-asparaginase
MPRILLLHTGGTLGMAGGRPSALKPAAFLETLSTRAPELFELADIELELFSNVDSCELQPEDWSRMAEHLHQRLPRFDGAVVTHGTDTLTYTASALSFMLPGLKKPVVLTGSQRPLGEIRSDARLNLVDAVISALRGPREVTVCFDSRLYRGNRARKVKVAEYDAFESPNFPVLGVLGVDARFEKGFAASGKPRCESALEHRVLLLKIHPGLDPEVWTGLLGRARGVVLEAYGAGTFPFRTARSLLPFFTEARKRRVPVVLISQAHRNGVDPSLYESGAAALHQGAINGFDMTPSAAVVKLMLALARFEAPGKLKAFMEESVAGELTAHG